MTEIYGQILTIILFFTVGLSILSQMKGYRERGLAEVLGLSFGASIAVLPLLLGMIYVVLGSIEVLHVWIILAVSGLAVIRRFRWVLSIKISLLDIYVIAATVITGVFFLFISLRNPYFPMFPSTDYLFHLNASQQYLNGQIALTPVTYPPAVHFIIGTGMLLMGGEPIVAMQKTMMILGALAPLLFYAVALRTTGSGKVALGAAVLYLPVGVWWYGLFTTGLYANVYANFVSLAILLFLVDYVKGVSGNSILLFALVSIGLYISHFTVVILLAALWVMLPLILVKARSSAARYFYGLCILMVPALILVAAAPSIVSFVVSLMSAPVSAGDIVVWPSGNLMAAQLGEVSVFLQFIYLSLHGEFLFFLALISLVAAPLMVLKKRAPIWALMFPVWFLTTWVMSPSTLLTWRSAYYALTPLSFTIALGVSGVISVFKVEKLVRSRGAYMRATRDDAPSKLQIAGLVATIFLIFAGSVVAFSAVDTFRSLEGSRRLDEDVYGAIMWIREETPSGAVIVAVGDWRFNYFQDLTRRTVVFKPWLPVEEVQPLIGRSDAEFLVTPRLVYRDGEMINAFKTYVEAGYVLAWENPSVVAFRISES